MPRRCRSPTAASTPTRSPSASATCRASRRRWREAYRVLKPGGRFLCLEFSEVDVPGLDALYELYSFNVDPGASAARSPATREPTAISSNRSASFPRPEALRRHDRDGRLRRVSFTRNDRRHRRAAFGLAACDRDRATRRICSRLARAGFVFAREGVLAAGRSDGRCRRRARLALRVARLIERRDQTGARERRLSAALTRLGPTYVKLGQFLATRPDVVGARLARDLEALQDKMAPFPQAEAERDGRGRARPAAVERCSRASDRRSPPPRSRRCIAPRSCRRRAATGRGQSAAAGRERRFARDLERSSLRRARCRALLRRGAAAAAGRGRSTRCAAVGHDRDGSAARSGGAFRDGGEHARRSRFPRARRSTGIAPRATC